MNANDNRMFVYGYHYVANGEKNGEKFSGYVHRVMFIDMSLFNWASLREDLPLLAANDMDWGCCRESCHRPQHPIELDFHAGPAYAGMLVDREEFRRLFGQEWRNL